MFQEMLNKLGVAKKEDRVRLVSKSQELFDLIAIKSSGIAASISDSTRILICIDISSDLLNIPFDGPTAVKLSAMTQKAYTNNRQNLMKLLDLNKKQDIASVMLKLGISNDGNLEKTAKRILETYKKMSFDSVLDHPQYITMSVFQACKIEKVKIPKKNCIGASLLRPSQWSLMEKSWDKWVGTIDDSQKHGIKRKLKEIEDALPVVQISERTLNKKRAMDTEIEDDYDVWMTTMCEKARAEIEKNGGMKTAESL